MGPLNWLAIVLGTVVFFAIGAVWYSAVFGKVWQSAVGKTTEELTSGRNMMAVMGTCLLLEFVVVLMLGHLFARIQPDDEAKLMMATGFGLAVMAPAIGITYLYMRKPLKLFLVDAGYFVVGMAAVGAVFALLD